MDKKDLFKNEAFKILLENNCTEEITKLKEGKISSYEFMEYIAEILLKNITSEQNYKKLLELEIDRVNYLTKKLINIQRIIEGDIPYFDKDI